MVCWLKLPLMGLLAIGVAAIAGASVRPAPPQPISPADLRLPAPTPLSGKFDPGRPRAQPEPGKLYVARVYARDDAEQEKLLSGGWDVLEARGPDYLLVTVDAETVAGLDRSGFRWALERELPPIAPGATDFYYGGYRTVAEHIAHLQAVSNTFPGLTTVITYGVSWKRQQNPAEGNDLFAICITNKRPGDCALNPETDKPRFFLIGSIHARELTTSEMVYRFIDALTSQYGVDADITALLDEAEVWAVPVVNPDGRQIVELGGSAPYTQRKNANTSGGACAYPPNAGSQAGIDLNRNANWRWGLEGASTFPCDLTYRGTSAASEPEEQALEMLFSQLFRDQRGPADIQAAPITTTGAMLTLHSYSNYVLLPWGDSGGPAPNDGGLRALAFRMGYYNWFRTGRPAEILYGVTGATDDFTYGSFGIASFTWEIGNASGSANYPTCSGFNPAYGCQDARFWPEARQGLIYAAKAARQPYALALGPTVLSASIAGDSVLPGATFAVQARLADDALSGEPGSVGRPASQVISAVEAYVDVPPWRGGAPVPLAARDGAFDQVKETALGTAAAPTSTGRHMVYVRGQDADGNWGPVTAVWLVVDDHLATPTPTPSGTPATPTPTSTPAACMVIAVATTVVITDSLSVMNCASLDVVAETRVVSLAVRLGASHPYVGDVRFQLRAPDGTALTLMNLPGLPGSGNSGQLNASFPITFADGAPYSAEGLGQAGAVVCQIDGRCQFAPAPDADPYSDLSSFSGFSGMQASGRWQMCAADHYPYDVGSLASAALYVNCDGANPPTPTTSPTPTATPTPSTTPTPTATPSATPTSIPRIYYLPAAWR